MTLEKRARLGLSIAQQSFGFFGSHKWLAVFPLLSLIFTCVFAAIVAFGVFEVVLDTGFLSAEATLTSSGAQNTVAAASSAQEVSGTAALEGTNTETLSVFSVVGLIVVFAVYLLIACIFTFCNVALTACVLSTFDGKKMGIGEGLALSARRFPTILGWSVLVALVGTLVQAIESRGSVVTSVIAIFSGLAWRVATFFVIPVIAAKDTGPISSVKDSVHILRKVWGESATVNIGFAWVKILIVLVAGGGLALAHFMFGVEGLLFAIPIMAPFILVAALFLSAIGTIARAALYYYAVEQKVPRQFEEAALSSALTRKA